MTFGVLFLFASTLRLSWVLYFDTGLEVFSTSMTPATIAGNNTTPKKKIGYIVFLFSFLLELELELELETKKQTNENKSNARNKFQFSDSASQ